VVVDGEADAQATIAGVRCMPLLHQCTRPGTWVFHAQFVLTYALLLLLETVLLEAVPEQDCVGVCGPCWKKRLVGGVAQGLGSGHHLHCSQGDFRTCLVSEGCFCRCLRSTVRYSADGDCAAACNCQAVGRLWSSI
jgi:hypothetical protein